VLNRQVKLAINTPSGRRDALADDAVIRKAAIKYKIPYITTLAAALAAAQGIKAARSGKGGVKSVQEYHKAIKEV
jgi:carbamoyl-phosphate synthase large subunit